MERKDILEKLAAKELTREQAEEMLSALGEPVPERIPEPPPQSNRGRNTGCLIAAIGTIILFGIIGLVLLGGLFFVRASAPTINQRAVPVQIGPPSQSFSAPGPELRIVDGQHVLEVNGELIQLTPDPQDVQIQTGETPALPKP